MTAAAGQTTPISAAEAVTLDGLFRERVARTSETIAYRDYNQQHANWRDYTWAQIDRQVARWQAALERDGLKAGDRVGVMLRNSPEWVIFDQAAMGLGLVVVPLYTQDRCDNVAYILNDANCKVLLLGTNEQWKAFATVRDQLGGIVRILTVATQPAATDEPRLKSVEQWLPDDGGATRHIPCDPAVLATIVYTSGTTGRPKGVMLSHRNILTNAEACLKVVPVTSTDVLLSFLPLSHTFERTCGYYLTVMCGGTTVYARSVQQLGEDLQTIRPTMLISVPRIYERVYSAIKSKLDDGSPLKKKLFKLAVDVGWARFEHQQGRAGWTPRLLLWPLLNALVASKIMARLGGNLKAAFAGGAALAPDVSRVFIGLGLPIIQGYGLTETSPVACANSLDDNVPASVGKAVPGVEIKIGDRNALMIKGPNVMLGYWNNEEATRAMVGPDSWLNSGDTARIDAGGHVFITGRLKEIIVMSTGEKIPPVDIEAAISRDTLFEQVMLIGEGKPYLSVLTNLNHEQWKKLAAEKGYAADASAVHDPAVEKFLLARIAAQMKEFPGYAQVRRIRAELDPWTVENGLLTPTLKLRRSRVLDKFQAELDQMYSGH
jgi:long-chain acyl-CoA synthetase